jgi:hypothetical protein
MYSCGMIIRSIAVVKLHFVGHCRQEADLQQHLVTGTTDTHQQVNRFYEYPLD